MYKSIGLSLFCLLGSILLSFGQVDSVYTVITSPVEDAIFMGPVDIPLTASVHSSSEIPYYEIEVPTSSWRQLIIGYDPSSIWGEEYDVSSHTHLSLSLKTIQGSVDWSKVLIKFDNTTFAIDSALSGTAVDSNWTSVQIPLSQFSGTDFSKIRQVKLISANGAICSFGLSELRFTGGGADFLWYGKEKYDNSHTGSSTATAGALIVSDQMDNGVVASEVAKVKFYANGNFIGEVSSPPFSLTYANVLKGSFALETLTEMADGSLHSSLPVNIEVNAASMGKGISLISPIDSSYASVEDQHISVKADLAYIAEGTLLHAYSPDQQVRSLRIGYTSHTLYGNPQNVLGSGNPNTHVSITLRRVGASIDWSKVGLKRGSTKVYLDSYLSSSSDTAWTTVAIPLSSFPSADFTSIAQLEFPYSNGEAFEMDIQKIEFTGGDTPFLWYGESKVDNSHNGVASNSSLESGLVYLDEYVGASFSHVEFYLDGVLVATDSTASASGYYEYDQGIFSQGWHDLEAIAVYSDGSYAISDTIDTEFNLIAPTGGISRSDAMIAGPAANFRWNLSSAQHLASGNTVLAWEEVSGSFIDVYFTIVDEDFRQISPPSGKSWPIKVNQDPLNLFGSSRLPEVQVNQQNGQIAIAFRGVHPTAPQQVVWLTVFDETGVPLSPYSSAEIPISDGVSGYIGPMRMAFDDQNHLYVGHSTYSASYGTDLHFNHLNPATGTNILANQENYTLSTDTELGEMAWSDDAGLLVSYRQDSAAYLAQFDPLLVFNQAVQLSAENKEAILPRISYNQQNERILASWIEADPSGNAEYKSSMWAIDSAGFDALIPSFTVYQSFESQQ
ncbi:MAG: hypothetical protein AAFQ87_15140, partial [Bacteroidota bacterium]